MVNQATLDGRDVWRGTLRRHTEMLTPRRHDGGFWEEVFSFGEDEETTGKGKMDVI